MASSRPLSRLRYAVPIREFELVDPQQGGSEAIYGRLRPRLFGIAYRVLGSAAEAEDVLQEVWLRWEGADRDVVRDPAAYLAAATTRFAINVAQSARSRRETYVGQWLPEPVDTSADPALGAESGEALELGVLRLLERLPPTERAAYVLKTAFDRPYSEIADTLQVTEVNARQYVSRARKHLDSDRHERVSADEHRRFLSAFLGAARTGDLASLKEVFAEDVVSYSDGGGYVAAARRPIEGRERVAKFISAISTWFWEDAEISVREVNGRAAILLCREGSRFAVLGVATSSSGICELQWQMNPTKLAAASRSLPDA